MLHQALGILDTLGARWTYYASFVVLGLAVPILVYLAWNYLIPLVRGRPLSRWVGSRRKHPTADETRRLRNVGQILGTLAHDVLKHRLLGLVSLVQSLDVLEEEEAQDIQPGERRQGVDTTRPEQWEGLRAELLRLCGARAAPGDRLWARWTDSFAEVRRLSGGRILPPWADKAFRRTDKTLKKLRRMVRGFVAGERESALSPERIRRLELHKLEGVHGVVLRIAEGCRPEVDPEAVIEEARSAVSALVGRRSARDRVNIGRVAAGRHLANAPARLIVTCLERLLDNALRLSGEQPVELEVELEHDELVGDEVLIFKVRDTIESIPTVDEFGTGLTNARRELSEFECGLSFAKLSPGKGEERQQFAKEARITVPVTPAEPLQDGQRARLPIQLAATATVFVSLLCFLATSRILGGAPVQFAGGGASVVEFRVEVGDELQFTLCEGGQDPRVDVRLEQQGCRLPGCSLAGVVKELQACSDGMSTKDCPGEFRWTPQVYDGSREGTSYELTIACRAPGPPASDDTRRVRLVVSRPNSPPQFNLLQMSDGVSDLMIPIPTDREVEVPAGGDFTIQAYARDDDDIDDRVLEFTLIPDNDKEQSMTSLDGRFALGELGWSSRGTWSATISVSDKVAPPVEKRIRLRAGALRPVAVEEMAVRNEVSGETLECVGPEDALLCTVSDDQSYTAELGIWFDPLLNRVDERLILSTSDDSAVTVTQRPDRLGRRQQIPEVGQRWDVRARYSERLLATVELIEIPTDTVSGLRRYRFRVDVEPLIASDPQMLTMKLNIQELSGRTEPLDIMLWLARSKFDEQPKIGMNRKYIELTEYELEADANQGNETVRVFLFEETGDRELATPEITCDAEALESAFEAPNLRSVGDGNWKIDVGLRPGCIEGLGGPSSAFGTDTSRTCRMDVSTQDGVERTGVRIRVNDKACAPEIVALEPVQEERVTEGAMLEWRLELLDPDGDLDLAGVKVKGASGFSFDLKPDPNSPGTRLFGTVRGSVSCEDLRAPLSVEVQDRTGFASRRELAVDMACPALVRTEAGDTSFEVDEGEEIVVPLVAESEAQLVLGSGPGEVKDNGWRWTANCANGRKHKVEIQGESATAYGDPLVLDVEIERCAVSLQLEETGSGRLLSRDAPIVMRPYRGRRLRVVPRRAAPQDLDIEVLLDSDSDELFARTLTGVPDVFDLQCREAGVTGTLQVKATPVDGRAGELLSAEPLELEVLCEDSGAD